MPCVRCAGDDQIACGQITIQGDVPTDGFPCAFRLSMRSQRGYVTPQCPSPQATPVAQSRSVAHMSRVDGRQLAGGWAQSCPAGDLETGQQP